MDPSHHSILFVLLVTQTLSTPSCVPSFPQIAFHNRIQAQLQQKFEYNLQLKALANMTSEKPLKAPSSFQQPEKNGSAKKLGLDGSSVGLDDHSMSSYSDGDGALGVMGTKSKLNDSDAIEIASKETRALVISRIIVGLVLLGAAAGVGALSYVLSSNREQESFENQVSIDLLNFFWWNGETD